MKNKNDLILNFHQGEVLKRYIINNEINKKGRLAPFLAYLGITRQSLYNLYSFREIKTKHRKAIIEYFNLPNDFFPNVVNKKEVEKAYVNLQIKYAHLEVQFEAEK